MDPNKLIDLQLQMRQNQDDLTDYLREMESWEKEIKVKEEKLMSKPIQSKDTVHNYAALPPVRNSLTKKVVKKKKKKMPQQENLENKPRKIRGSDYRSWDRFDVEKACAEIDEKNEKQKSSSSSEYETDEEMEESRKNQLTNNLRDEGNQYFKKGQYDLAIECYSRGLELSPDNVLLLLNRAMALLKQEKFGAAEQDCTKTILLGTKDAKAWFRRGCARESLKRYKEALNDFEEVLKLDPRNKAAQSKIETVKNILNPEPPSNVVKAVYIPPEKRSMKPLRRITIEEIGADDDETQNYHTKAKTSHSAEFDRFLTNGSDTKCVDVPDHSITEGTSPTMEIPETVEKSCKRTNYSEDSKTDLSQTLVNEMIPDESNDVKSLKTEKEQSATHGRNLEESSDFRTLRTEQKPSTASVKDSFVPARTESLKGAKSEGFPTVPKSSCQFLVHWKTLKRKSKEFFEYFKQINPNDYHDLFTSTFDDELLTKILTCLQEFYLSEKLDVFPVLEQLTKVGRFSTIIMFLSPKYKQVLKELFTHVESSDMHNMTEVKTVEKLYEL